MEYSSTNISKTETTISSKNNQISHNKNSKNLICEECWSIPLIEEIQDLYITISCDHLFLPNIIPSEFYNYFTVVDNEQMLNKIMILKDFKCSIHLKEYEYYDTKCQINLCSECITSNKKHKKHEKISLDAYDIIFKKQYIEKRLKEIDKNNSEIDKNEKMNIRNELNYFYEIIKIILSAYEELPCYKHYKNIEIIYSYFTKKENRERLVKIKNKNELIVNLNNNEYKHILSINMNGQNPNLEKTLDKCIKLKKIKIINLNSMKELNLGKNKMKNIKPLLKFKMPILEKLDLSVNFLGDELIEDIDKLDCPELSYLNLYKVHLESYYIFNKMKHFQKLKILFIGLNKFSTTKNQDITEETKFDLSSIEIIGLSKIWSNEEGVKDLQYFKFRNLNTLYLSGNNINSIDSIIDIDCDKSLLKKLWLVNNNLKEFLGLNKFIYLEQLEISNNQINDITSLEKFLNNLKYLKEFNLENNMVDYNQQDNNLIIEKERSKNKFLKLLT